MYVCMRILYNYTYVALWESSVWEYSYLSADQVSFGWHLGWVVSLAKRTTTAHSSFPPSSQLTWGAIMRSSWKNTSSVHYPAPTFLCSLTSLYGCPSLHSTRHDVGRAWKQTINYCEVGIFRQKWHKTWVFFRLFFLHLKICPSPACCDSKEEVGCRFFRCVPSMWILVQKL